MLAYTPYDGATFIAFAEPGAAYPGEADLWVRPRDAARVAIDLGKTGAMGSAIGEARPQTLILTHDDDDHIGGWEHFRTTATFYAAWPDEIWIPYEWAAVVSIAGQLDFESSDDEADEMTVIARISRAVRVVNSGWAPEDADELKETDPLEAVFGGPADEIRSRLLRLRGDERFAKIITKALDAVAPGVITDELGPAGDVADRVVSSANRILNILETARTVGIRVRLFSVDHAREAGPSPWRTVGKPGLVTIPNAREVVWRPRRRQRRSLAHFAVAFALSVQNRRALTVLLWSSPEEGTSKAMVWSDSTGNWANDPATPLPVELLTLTTAPHHGSENTAHTAAWSSLWTASRDLVIAAVGGSSIQQVHGAFLAVPVTQRSCTKCRHTTGRPNRGTLVVEVLPSMPARLTTAHCVD